MVSVSTACCRSSQAFASEAVLAASRHVRPHRDAGETQILSLTLLTLFKYGGSCVCAEVIFA